MTDKIYSELLALGISEGKSFRAIAKDLSISKSNAWIFITA